MKIGALQEFNGKGRKEKSTMLLQTERIFLREFTYDDFATEALKAFLADIMQKKTDWNHFKKIIKFNFVFTTKVFAKMENGL